MEVVILGGVLVLCVLLSIDVALSMLIATLVMLLWESSVPLTLVAEKALSQVSLFPLLAIPGFIIAGELMNVIGMTQALGNTARLLVGRWRGGMGYATILACMVFGGMTGSGLAETVAIGSLMIPLLASHGYPKSFSAAMVASGGALGPIVPPSIPMVIYASIAPTVSITALFISGIVPGILLGMGFLMVVAWRVRALNIRDAVTQEEVNQTNVRQTLLDALPAFGVPLIIFYFIFSGLSTVTEAAVLAAAYVAVYGFLRGKLKLGDLMEAGKSTLVACGIFGFIIAAAGPFSFLMALFQAPETIGEFLLGFSGGNTIVLMLLVAVILLALGLLVEATSLVIIFAPILAATASIAGVDQLHMALVAIVALMVGLFTPPVGTNLFAVVGISGEKIEDVSREMIPFVLIAVVIVLILAVFPSLVLFLPNLILG
jgi:tripartite ATP-independent transporter DctM subunit